MKLYSKFLLIIFAVLIAMPSITSAISDDEAQKIADAAPSKAPAAPKKPRKILIFTLCKGFPHSSIPYCTAAVETLGKKTGAFTTVVSDDMKVFRADSLKQFDAVCFNNTTKLTFDEEPGLRKSLMDFVKGGKGIIGIHAATDNFYTWPEAAEMIGGTFDGHPWGSGGTWKVRIEDPKHPVAASFKGKDFKINDEIYRTKTINLRDNSRVLIGLDMSDAVNMSAKGIRPADTDIAIAWVRDYGKGRLFYSSLGHTHHPYWTTDILEHYLAGIQFAIGDLKADATPLPFKKSHKPVDVKALDSLLKSITSFAPDQSRASLVAIENIISNYNDNSEELAKIEKLMLKFIQTDISPAAKDFICRNLSVIGSELSAPVLGVMLVEADTSNIARFALERIPGKAVDEVLLMTLSQTTGEQQIGIVNSLGHRKTVAAVDQIIPLTKSKDTDLAIASITALGEIASPKAAKALAKIKNAKGAKYTAAMDAYLKCGDAFLARGNSKKAMDVYSSVYKSAKSGPVKTAALTGIVTASPEDAIDTIIDVLKTGNPAMQASAIALVRRMKGNNEAITLLTKQLPKLQPASQVQLIGALADIEAQKAMPAVVALTDSPDETVKVAALKAMSAIGDASVVSMLAANAADSASGLQDTARTSLYEIRHKTANPRIIDLISETNTPSPVKVELIKAVEKRRIIDAVPSLITMGGTDNADVRIQALKALRTVNDGNVANILHLLLSVSNSTELGHAQRTLLAVAAASPEKSAPLIEKSLTIAGTKQKAAMLGVLGKLASDSSLPVLRKATTDGNDDIADAAVRALASWPNTTPLNDLFEIASTAKSDSRKAVALRGYIKLAALTSDISSEKTVELLAKALEIAPTPNEKKAILAVLPKFACDAALELAKKAAQQSALRSEADLAVEKIKTTMMTVNIKLTASRNNEKTSNALDNKPSTRWDSGQTMRPGIWVVIDLSFAFPVKSITLDTKGSANDYPRGYEVFASKDGKNWGKAIKKDKPAKKPVTVISFDEPVSSRYFKIVQTGSSNNYYWSIHELTVQEK
ncbi:MAG: ThuA domain-containing protein [Anaerohalosphaera sp.]|nr:ThuA domain-containing protein [Anaerohalosphaera sp.]